MTDHNIHTPLLMVACTGNICRSPMAEAVLRHHLALRGVQAQVASCGLDAPVGRTPHKFALQVNQARGVPIDQDKRSEACMSAVLKHSTLLLVMENHHRHTVLRRHPFASGKTFLLGHWQGQEIADPLREPLPAFEQVFDQIDQGCSAWIDHMLQAGLLPAPSHS
ncbi:low molecular weight phosphotyrosine protein phosphatase [Alcaligenaceae bacterium]|nr:low molecular weight phosphotyrosine protein phosphatase [Alcaligenaceae bacterium]